MKKITGLSFLLCFTFLSIRAQLCPGGGSAFATSVTFSQSWISSCLTGTSCNGGVEFDNRAPCEPTATMDACAPAPSCTVNAQDGSDLWFNFFATGTTATINAIQNVSFIACIQAFSGGPTCGALTAIGCAKAGGPSSGISLNLSGLTINQQYFFRIFGSASASSQRTGTFCFCGSTGLGSSVLPIILSSFKATVQTNSVVINWTTASETNNRYFEIERSNDGVNYVVVSKIAGKGTTSLPSSYTFTDAHVLPGRYYYRLKQTDIDGRFTYSDIVSAFIKRTGRLVIYPVPAKNQLIVESTEKMRVALINSSGQLITYYSLKTGINNLSVSKLPSGMYLLRNDDFSESNIFFINH